MKTFNFSAATLLLCLSGSLMVDGQDSNTVAAASDSTAVTTATNTDSASPAVPAENASATPTPGADTSASSTTDTPSLSSFQIVARRNVFDPNRQPYSAPIIRHVPQIDTFSFRGADHYVGKAEYDAVFLGSGVMDLPYHVGGTVNGFKIEDIKKDEVKLLDTKSTNHDEKTLKTAEGLTRVDGGAWSPTYVSPIYAASPVVSRAVSTSDSGSGQYGGGQTTFTPDNSGDTGYSADTTGNGGFNNNGNGSGRRRNRGQNNFQNNFGNRGAFTFPQTDAAAPAAPVDPAVLARLAARRAQEK